VEQEFQADGGASGAAAAGAEHGTQGVSRAAQLLVLVLESESPRGVGELAQRAQLPKSSASRLLAALERHGLVRQEGRRGRFRPGPVLLRFAHRGLVDRNLVELAQQPLHALADATGETINLAVAGPRGVEHLVQVDSRHFLGAGRWVGRRVAYHCTAVGKVLLAFGAGELPADQPLEPLTSCTIVDRARLEAELEQVRRDRFATAADELESGLTAMAAPVVDALGTTVAALSVSGPTLRLTPKRVAELAPVIIGQARALSERLGHRHEEVHAA
jgi:IclR family transcriptional regulator, acetate operon repressor